MAINYRNVDEFDAYMARLEDDFFDNEEPEGPRRYLRDLQNPVEFYTNVQFKLRYRFDKESVMAMMVSLHIEERLARPDNRGLPIPPLIQLLTAIRFYASGSFQTVLGDLRHVSQPTVSRVLHRVTNIIADQLQAFVFFPPTPEGMLANQIAFFDNRGFPGATGMIDGTHIPIENPGGQFGETFRNRKRFFSINVQVVCGPRGELLDVVARWPGSTHDARIFANSSVKMRYERGLLTGCLVGDSGYPCLPFILTPLLATHSEAEERYNRAHKRVRNLVECCIGKWKRRLLCLKKGLARKPENVVSIICACAVLHNMAVGMNDAVPEGDIPERVVPVQPMAQPQRGPGAVFRRAFIARHFE